MLGNKCGVGSSRPIENNWEILPYSKEALAKALSSNNCLDITPRLGYVHNYLEYLKCGVIVIEAEYVDKDFLDDYSHYYVRCFKEYERFCRRVHFFGKFDESVFKSYLDGRESSKNVTRLLSENYIGFIVAKPLPYTVVGRTILRPWDNTVTDGEDKSGWRSIRCVNDYRVNLGGIELQVKSLAFQEQDKVLAACATSALWSAFQRTSSVFSHSIPTLYDITSHATKYLQLSRCIPSEGLSATQMCQAIKEVGLEAELREVHKPSDRRWQYHYPLLCASYGYLRAGFPVILSAYIEGEGYHAITLVGYSIGDETTSLDEMRIWGSQYDLRLKGSRIVKFYAHDDQIGPFSRLEVDIKRGLLGGVKMPIKLWSSWKRRQSGKPTPLIPLSIIVPVYHKIRVPFISTFDLASSMEFLLTPFLEGDVQIEWDIFLSSVNDYKKELTGRSELGPQILGKVRKSFYPRYFWRARAFVGSEEICEMIIDATDMQSSFQLHDLHIFHPLLHEVIVAVCGEIKKVNLGYVDPKSSEYDPILAALIRHIADRMTPQQRNSGVSEAPSGSPSVVVP
jgi:hypothetical protein